MEQGATLLALWPVLVFMAVQSGGAIWWAATTTQRLSTLEEKARNHNGNGEKLASIDARLEALEGDIKQFMVEMRGKRR